MPVAKARVRLDGADPINRGLLGFWPLTDGAGTIARDVSPFRGNGISYVNGAVAHLPDQPSRFGKTPKFSSGSPSTKITVNNPSGLLAAVQAPLTILAWINPTATSGTQTIFGQYSSTSASRLIKLLRLDGANLSYYTSNAAGGFQVKTGSAVTAGVWQLVGVTVDPALASRIYVGKTVSVDAFAAVSSTPDTTVPITIGDASAGFSEGFTGNISGVRVYSRALQPSEFARILADPWAGTARPPNFAISSLGTTFNDTISDAVTAAESNAATATVRPTLSDAVTAAESNAAAVTANASVSDAATSAEAMAAVATFNAAVSDNTTAADAVTGTVSTVYNEAITDGVTASENMEGDFPNTGDTHDGFIRRSRRERALDAAQRRADEQWRIERNAVRLALEAAMGMAAEVVEDAPAEAVAAVQEAVREARAVAPAPRAPVTDLAPVSAALERLNAAIEAAARAKALAEDDEEVLMLLRAL